MPKYDAVVIGAGNGGLAAACRLAKAGKRTLLIEQHNLPGGVATSFRRGRFEFETALHELCELGSVENPGGARKMHGGRFWSGHTLARGAGQFPRHHHGQGRFAHRRDAPLRPGELHQQDGGAGAGLPEIGVRLSLNLATRRWPPATT
jgi:glycine/D-amino acid oxidase-like deaminating enzyme